MGVLCISFFNMLVLWMFGSELEERWGKKEFLRYYLLCGSGAGVFVFIIPILLSQNLGIPTVGASGSLFGLLMAYAIYWPNRYVLIWFLFPIKIKYLVIIIGVISFLFTFQSSGSGGISHVGHLGGLVTGYLYLLFQRKG